MKVILTEGSIHHLKTMTMSTAPRVGEQVIVDNDLWEVESVTHFPKEDSLNHNETCCGWDEDQDADMSIHLVRED